MANEYDKILRETFDPGELLLAVLAENGDKQRVIQEILTKLRILTEGDNTFFKEKLKHLELLAQLRGKNLQNQIVKEEEHMPITIDIRKDLRYQQGVEEGEKEGALKNSKKNALKMLEKGISAEMVREITGLTIAQLKELQSQVKA